MTKHRWSCILPPGHDGPCIRGLTHIDEALIFVTAFTMGGCMLVAGIITLAIGVLLNG